jgi:hypothetical protein
MARRGRPPRAWRWLVHDVDCVRARRHCSILDACGHLADGDYAEMLPLALPRNVIMRVNGRAVRPLEIVKVVWGRWKGMKVATLETMYYRARRAKIST